MTDGTSCPKDERRKPGLWYQSFVHVTPMLFPTGKGDLGGGLPFYRRQTRRTCFLVPVPSLQLAGRGALVPHGSRLGRGSCLLLLRGLIGNLLKRVYLATLCQEAKRWPELVLIGSERRPVTCDGGGPSTETWYTRNVSVIFTKNSHYSS